MSDLPASRAKRDDAARLLRGTARRRAVAVRDLLLPEALRLSEHDRLTACALLDRLVRVIEDELRAGLAALFADREEVQASLASDHVEIAGLALNGSVAIDDPELVNLLLRRAEEHRLYLAAGDSNKRLEELVADRDAEVAGHAMAALVARSRRLDRFQEPILARTELPAELQHRLVWTIAAALRAYLVEQHEIEPAAVDAALGQIASGLVAGYDEGDTLEARCSRLARILLGAGRLDGAGIADFLAEGTLPLFLAGLSAATDIPLSAVWDILKDPEGRGPVLLLKAAGLDRQQAGQSLLLLSRQPEDERLIEQIEHFDLLDAEEADRGLSLWLLDPAYREAVLRLAEQRLAA